MHVFGLSSALLLCNREYTIEVIYSTFLKFALFSFSIKICLHTYKVALQYNFHLLILLILSFYMVPCITLVDSSPETKILKEI